ncbi:hypothetical protein KJ359_007532 [Pestalotiopsis sp. 9143b]|nr:hypothetical protein KJ359_007532 [Pestalotiopsis sp. 9143b]
MRPGRGILTINFDPTKPADESLQIIDEIAAGYQPGWICGRDENVYSVARTNYPDNSSVSGAVFSFDKDKNNDQLSSLGSTISDGEGGVFCDVNHDGFMLSVANIDGSTVSLHPRSPTGIIGASSHVFKFNLTQPGPGTNDSQIQSNPHQAAFGPSGPWGQLMVVPDRGADRLYVYRVQSSAGPAPDVQLAENITLPLGTGPRHVVFQVIDEDLTTLMYLVSEIDNTIRVFSISGLQDAGGVSSGTLNITLLQTASTLGPGSNRTAPNNERLASELALSNDGKFLYVSNRDTTTYDSDTLAIFSIASPLVAAEPLKYLGTSLTLGKIPRHFSLSPEAQNTWVAVANQVSNSVFVFKRDPTNGFLDGVVGNLTLGDFDQTLQNGPMAVVWA